jgi:hypothetical protein
MEWASAWVDEITVVGLSWLGIMQKIMQKDSVLARSCINERHQAETKGVRKLGQLRRLMAGNGGAKPIQNRSYRIE